MSGRHAGLWLTVDGQTVDLMARVKDENGCVVSALEDSNLGEAEPATEVLTSMLRDGDLTVQTGTGNRQQPFAVRIKGPSLGAIALTEEKLQRDFAGRAGLLRWQPDDLSAQPCIFEVTWSHLAYQFNDWEGGLRQRLFLWTFDSLPFARAEHPTRFSLSTGGAAPTVVNDASAVAGWSASEGTVSLVDGPAVRVAGFNGPPAAGGPIRDRLPVPTVTLADSFTLSAGEFLHVETYGQTPSTARVTEAAGPGVYMPFVTRMLSPAGGNRYISVFGPASRDAAATGVLFGGEPPGDINYWPPSWWKAWNSLDLVEFRGVATSPDLSEGRQALLDFAAEGSAPTYGSLTVSSPGWRLGDVILYSAPRNGSYSPALSGYVSGITTAEETADMGSPSGRSWALREEAGSRRFGADFPARQFTEPGAATLWLAAWSTHATTERIYWSSAVRLGGVEVGRTIRGEIWHTFKAAFAWELIPVANIPVPATQVGDEGVVQVHVAQEAAGATGVVSVGDGYLLRTGKDYATTAVAAGDATHLYINAPSVGDPTGSVWVSQGDRGEAYQAGSLVVDGAHRPHAFLPTGTRLWVLTGSPSAYVDGEFYRRNHDHMTYQPHEGVGPGPVT